MALNMSKKDCDMLQNLLKKQKEARQEQAKFRKMILENRNFVINVLKESSSETPKAEGGFGLGESKGE